MGGAKVAMIAYTNYATDPRVIREAETAVEAGFGVDFFSLKKPGDPAVEIINGVRVIRLNHQRYRGSSTLTYLMSYLIFFVKCFIKVSAFQIQNNYKIVHVNNMPDFMVFSAVVPKTLGAKIILDIHDPMGITFSNKFKAGNKSIFYKLLMFQERISAAFANHLVTVTEILKRDLLVAVNGLDPDKITVVENFPKDENFAFIENYSIGEKIKLVYHGTIAERYGIQNILKALAEIPERNTFLLKIIGEGDYSAQLKKLITDLHLDGIVEFDNHHYPVEKLRDILAGYHVGMVSFVVSPALNFMSFTKLMEYVALGLPAITLSNKVIRFHFKEEDCLFYDPNDLSTLRKRLEEIAHDKTAIYRARERLKACREKFLWSNEGKKYVEVLNKLAGQ